VSGRVKVVETGRDGYPDQRTIPHGRQRGALRQAKARQRARVRRALQRTRRIALRKGVRPLEPHERSEHHVAPGMKGPLALDAGVLNDRAEYGRAYDHLGYEEGRVLFTLMRQRRAVYVADADNPF
jgi:hypothetical protein